MNDDGDGLSVAQLVEYYRTHAGHLSGQVETIGAEINDLLDDINDDITAVRTDLTKQGSDTHGPTPSPTTAEPVDAKSDVADLEEKQLIAEAKQARMTAFQDLAVSYIESTEELISALEDTEEAMDRLLRFERYHDAPTYFDDRQTLLEAAADPDGSPPE